MFTKFYQLFDASQKLVSIEEERKLFGKAISLEQGPQVQSKEVGYTFCQCGPTKKSVHIGCHTKSPVGYLTKIV